MLINSTMLRYLDMAHNNYYLDLCVDTYVVNEGSVLLRFHEKYNFWGTPGGHVDPGQDVNEAALREVQEEAGLDVELVGPSTWSHQPTKENQDLVPPIFINRHSINDHHDHSSFIFVAKSDSREINPHEDEDQDVKFKWVTNEELNEMYKNGELRDDVYRYASTALDLVKKF